MLIPWDTVGPIPWPPGTLYVYPLITWSPVGPPLDDLGHFDLPFDPLEPCRPTPWPPLPTSSRGPIYQFGLVLSSFTKSHKCSGILGEATASVHKKCNHGDSLVGQHFLGHQNKIPHKTTSIVGSGCSNWPKIYHFCHLQGGQTALSPFSNSYFRKRILTVIFAFTSTALA